jgi:hypothetical protein
VAVGSTRCVHRGEAGLLGVVAHPLSIGKIERPFKIERLGIHVRQTASRARCPRAILLERQRCDITAHGVTQTLPILLPTCIFRAHLEWLSEVTEAFIGIKINRHRRNVEAWRVAVVAWLLQRGKHLPPPWGLLGLREERAGLKLASNGFAKRRSRRPLSDASIILYDNTIRHKKHLVHTRCYRLILVHCR